MEKTNHLLKEKIKAKILEELMKSDLNFSQLLNRIELRDHGQLNYHLNLMIKNELIEKKDGKYSVSDYGKKMGVYIKQFQLKEMYPICVVCNIVKNKKGEMLLFKRAKHPEKGKWGFPGGKVVFGESMKDAAEREFLEETGLTIKAKKVLGIFPVVVHENNKPSFHVILIPVLMQSLNGNENILLNREELDEYSYVDLKNTDKTFVSVNRQILEELKSGKFAFKEFVHKL